MGHLFKAALEVQRRRVVRQKSAGVAGVTSVKVHVAGALTSYPKPADFAKAWQNIHEPIPVAEDCMNDLEETAGGLTDGLRVSRELNPETVMKTVPIARTCGGRTAAVKLFYQDSGAKPGLFKACRELVQYARKNDLLQHSM